MPRKPKLPTPPPDPAAAFELLVRHGCDREELRTYLDAIRDVVRSRREPPTRRRVSESALSRFPGRLEKMAGAIENAIEREHLSGSLFTAEPEFVPTKGEIENAERRVDLQPPVTNPSAEQPWCPPLRWNLLPWLLRHFAVVLREKPVANAQLERGLIVNLVGWVQTQTNRPHFKEVAILIEDATGESCSPEALERRLLRDQPRAR